MTTPRRALLSVSDKAGIQDFGRRLVERGFQLLSTGGTARTLREAGLPVTEVAEITGHPEIMEGRVKTLHPAIHGPLLARRDVPGDLDALADHGYRPIDLVAVNLYPFRESVAEGGVPVREAMEQVDIGGPTMIRAAAKNHAHVLVVVDPGDYMRALEVLDREEDAAADDAHDAAAADDAPADATADDVPAADQADTASTRRDLAAKVFRHVSDYDAAVAAYLEEGEETGAGEASSRELPPVLTRRWQRHQALRYGENPDQAAALYRPDARPLRGIASLEQHHGKALSYNNLLDLDGVLLSLAPFALSTSPAVCIVKHTTPSGIGVGNTVLEAYEKALACDPVSAFGSVVAANRAVDEDAAEALSDLFVECIVAPVFSDDALEILTRKKNIRILTLPAQATWPGAGALPDALTPEVLEAFEGRVDDGGAVAAARFLAAHAREPDPVVLRGIYGALLAQTPPAPPFVGLDDPDWKVVSERAPTDAERENLAFAWAAAFGVKSNAIVLTGGGATLGIGAGQMSRVDASKLAVRKADDAGLELEGCALASDAFFPFRDGVDAAAGAGVRAIIQPGGSKRDGEVIEAADEHDIAMIFTGRRLFRH